MDVLYNQQLNVLHLENDPLDAELIRIALEKSRVRCRIRLICTQTEFETALASGTVDAVLSDSSMPGFDTFEALRIVQETTPSMPFIFVSGNTSPEKKAEAVCKGAIDHLSKDQLPQLILHLKRIALRNTRLPETGEPVLVHCEGFDCLGYLDTGGVWRDYGTSNELTAVLSWESV